MATIIREFVVNASVDQVWTGVADVGAVNRLIDFVGEVTLDGERRICRLGDAGTLEELIVTIDDERRRLAYSIKESPFGFTHHHASMQVDEHPAGGSRFVWITDVAPDSLAGAAVAPVDAAVESIKRHFA